MLAVFVLLEKNGLYKGCKVNITLAQEVITSLTYEMKKGKKPQTFIALSSRQTICLEYVMLITYSEGRSARVQKGLVQKLFFLGIY